MARKLPPPNYTQAPNVYYDEWLSQIKGEAELKVINVVIRETFGWHRDRASLSITDIQKKAGLSSRSSATRGAQRAVEHGYLVREKEGDRWLYALNVEEEGTSTESVPVGGTESVPAEKSGSPDRVPVASTESVPVASPESVPAYKDKEKGSKKELKKEDPSVATQRGAEAPSAPQIEIPKTVKDPEDFTVWNLGLKMMLKSFRREDQSRSFIGKQIKDFGKPLVVRAVIDMLANEPINPSEYLVKTLQEMKTRDAGGRKVSSFADVGKYVPGPSTVSQEADYAESRMEFHGMDLDEALKPTPPEIRDNVRAEIERRDARIAQHCRMLADHVRRLSEEKSIPLETALERGIGSIDEKFRTTVALMLSGEFLDQQPNEAVVQVVEVA